MSAHRRSFVVAIAALTAWVCPARADEPAGDAGAAPPLHTRVDAIVSQSLVGPVAPRSDDAEFVRRVWLDLAGVIPPAHEVRAFLDDVAPNKREQLIDRLLESREFSRHMANVFDAMLRERRAQKHIDLGEWREYLLASFEQRKPLNQLARELLVADGADAAPRPAVEFYLAREGDPHAVTRDVGRVFLGRDMQCAQCHDHPLVDSYLQADYYGLNAFVARGTLFTSKENVVFYAEKADGEAAYKSVFTEDAAENVPPRLPHEAPVEETIPTTSEAYVVAPADGVRPVPRVSRRMALAEQATTGAHADFNRNFANRLWAMLVGRGLVHPLDLHHDDNRPTHPELLDLLADELAASQFDLRSLLREIALSETYQRTSDSASLPFGDSAQFAARREELAADAERTVAAATECRSRHADLLTSWTDAQAAEIASLSALSAARRALEGAKFSAAEANDALTKHRQEIQLAEEAGAALTAAAAAANAAIEKVAGDEPLANAAAEFAARAEQWTKKIEELRAKTAEREAAAAKATEALTTAEPAVAPAESAAATAKSALAELRDRAAAANAEVAAADAASQRAAQRLQQADAWLGYGRNLAELAAAEAQRVRMDQAKAESAERLALVDAQFAAAERLVADKSAVMSSAASALAEIEARRNSVRETVDHARQLADEARRLADKLGGDASAAQAAELLIAAADRATTEVASIDASVVQRREELTRAEEDRNNSVAAIASLEQARAEAVASSEQAAGAMRQAVENVAACQQSVDAQRDAICDQRTVIGGLAPLKELSPEQLAWSMAQATGALDSVRKSAAEEVANPQPAKEGEPAPVPLPEEERPRAIERKTAEKLQGAVDAFVRVFGTSPGAPPDGYQATVHQALFLENGGLLAGWLSPSGENLAARLVAAPDAPQLADELYLSVLSRRPSEEEAAVVAEMLAERADRRAEVVNELMWGLLSSIEFRFNH